MASGLQQEGDSAGKKRPLEDVFSVFLEDLPPAPSDDPGLYNPQKGLTCGIASYINALKFLIERIPRGVPDPTGSLDDASSFIEQFGLPHTIPSCGMRRDTVPEVTAQVMTAMLKTVKGPDGYFLCTKYNVDQSAVGPDSALVAFIDATTDSMADMSHALTAVYDDRHWYVIDPNDPAVRSKLESAPWHTKKVTTTTGEFTWTNPHTYITLQDDENEEPDCGADVALNIKRQKAGHEVPWSFPCGALLGVFVTVLSAVTGSVKIR